MVRLWYFEKSFPFRGGAHGQGDGFAHQDQLHDDEADYNGQISSGSRVVMLLSFAKRHMHHVAETLAYLFPDVLLEADDDAVAIDAVVAKHLFHRNLTRSGALVGDELDEVRVACHGVGLSLWFLKSVLCNSGCT